MTVSYEARLTLVEVTDDGRTRRTRTFDHLAIESAASLSIISDRIVAHLLKVSSAANGAGVPLAAAPHSPPE